LALPPLDGLVRGLDEQRCAGVVGVLQHRVGEALQLAEFRVELGQCVGGVPMTVGRRGPGAHVRPPRVVEFLGTASGPAVHAHRVQYLTAVLVQFGECRQPIPFIADGAQVSCQCGTAHARRIRAASAASTP
jgi:hypothetical protein